MAEVDTYTRSLVAAFDFEHFLANGTVNFVEGSSISPANGVAESIVFVGGLYQWIDGSYTFTMEEQDPDTMAWTQVAPNETFPPNGFVLINSADIRMGYIGKRSSTRIKVVAFSVIQGARLSLTRVHSALSSMPIADQPPA